MSKTLINQTLSNKKENKVRLQIEDQISKFIENGGIIERIPTGISAQTENYKKNTTMTVKRRTRPVM